MIICIVVLLWSPLIVWKFNTGSIYCNPFFRGLEFLIGVVICSIEKDLKKRNLCFLYCKRALVVEFLFLILGVTIGIKLKISLGNYMLYNWVALPMFILLLISFHEFQSDRLKNSKILKYLCDISYVFFFAQFFTWDVTKFILRIIGYENNILKIVISFIMCIFISILLHECMEKPVTKFLKRYF